MKWPRESSLLTACSCRAGRRGGISSLGTNGLDHVWPNDGRKHFSKTRGASEDPLAGRLVVSAGLGGMGGAQPLAATMNGAAFLGVDVNPARIERRLQTGYIDR